MTFCETILRGLKHVEKKKMGMKKLLLCSKYYDHPNLSNDREPMNRMLIHSSSNDQANHSLYSCFRVKVESNPFLYSTCHLIHLSIQNKLLPLRPEPTNT
ncbi:hypothetical protein DERP_007539 [Dermatophagoides pteronyssinus]|uniref:Uncharacterized protein n=1 Tax=Dermatophagoides pteronyssinus TaxID=6956 RepID=A0ABQ8JK20_DERPT|nr:hypothetical protein DERP_007539 [Dermatophagoides pteronyssinus]